MDQLVPGTPGSHLRAQQKLLHQQIHGPIGDIAGGFFAPVDCAPRTRFGDQLRLEPVAQIDLGHGYGTHHVFKRLFVKIAQGFVNVAQLFQIQIGDPGRRMID